MGNVGVTWYSQLCGPERALLSLSHSLSCFCSYLLVIATFSCCFGGHCVLFPSTQLPLWVFQDGFRKPCKFDQVPSTDHALLHFLPFAWEPLGKLLIWLVPGASEYITALQRGAWVGDVVGDMSKASTWPGLPLTVLPTPQFEMLNAELEENQELANSRMAELEKLQAELQGAVRPHGRLKVSCVGGWEGLSLRSRG